MLLLLPLDTSASATPQSPPVAVILDALEPLRCLSHLVTHDATEETASCPVCYTSSGLGVEAPVHSKAVLWGGGGSFVTHAIFTIDPALILGCIYPPGTSPAHRGPHCRTW